jgi:hypothetical protein
MATLFERAAILEFIRSYDYDVVLRDWGRHPDIDGEWMAIDRTDDTDFFIAENDPLELLAETAHMIISEYGSRAETLLPRPDRRFIREWAETRELSPRMAP